MRLLPRLLVNLLGDELGVNAFEILEVVRGLLAATRISYIIYMLDARDSIHTHSSKQVLDFPYIPFTR